MYALSYHVAGFCVSISLQKLKYDIHTKLLLESYQFQFWYHSMHAVAILYEYHTTVFVEYSYVMQLGRLLVTSYITKSR